jgi:hypothetical protein
MTQTRERRIFLHYKAIRKRHDYRRGEWASPLVQLARWWGIPVREAKEIIETQKAGTDARTSRPGR